MSGSSVVVVEAVPDGRDDDEGDGDMQRAMFSRGFSLPLSDRCLTIAGVRGEAGGLSGRRLAMCSLGLPLPALPASDRDRFR